MKKKLNTLFFSMCFMAALIAESYFIQSGDGDLFSIVGIGAVVLITGYLLMDSIRNKMLQSSKEAKDYLDQIYLEVTEKWNERYTELTNLQKASYTAAKKNTAMLSVQFDEVLQRLETLEVNNTKALLKMTELQKKSLEGQKNALNLEINYSKENTKQLIKVLRELDNRSDVNELLNKLLEGLEKNNEILENKLSNMEYPVFAEQPKAEIELDNSAKIENLTYHDWNNENEIELEKLIATGWNTDVEVEGDLGDTDENIEKEPDTEEDINIISELDKLIADWDTESESEGNVENENVSEASASNEEESLSETVDLNVKTDNIQESMPEIKPLYADPNKALTADEIAALFASAGK